MPSSSFSQDEVILDDFPAQDLEAYIIYQTIKRSARSVQYDLGDNTMFRCKRLNTREQADIIISLDLVEFDVAQMQERGKRVQQIDLQLEVVVGTLPNRSANNLNFPGVSGSLRISPISSAKGFQNKIQVPKRYGKSSIDRKRGKHLNNFTYQYAICARVVKFILFCFGTRYTTVPM